MECSAVAAQGAEDVLSMVVDVSSLSDVQKFKAKVYERFGETAFLLNNAGTALAYAKRSARFERLAQQPGGQPLWCAPRPTDFCAVNARAAREQPRALHHRQHRLQARADLPAREPGVQCWQSRD